MLDVTGFRGLTFNNAQVASQDAVITPPYDVISAEDRQTLAQRSPFSLVHILLPESAPGKSEYETAAEIFRGWIAAKVLEQDASPSLYLLRQQFTDPEGNRRLRKGFFAAARLPEKDESYVLGHERTFFKPVEDRLNLTAALRAQPGAVFVLYSDPENRITPFLDEMEARPAHARARTIDGVEQEFWRIPANPEVTEFFENKTLYIADGHHRFQTAMAYRDRMRAAHPDAPADAPWNYVMMGFVALEDPGLQIYPAHRIVPVPEKFDAASFLRDLTRYFTVEETAPDTLADRVKDAAGGCVIGLALPGGADYLLTLREDQRDALLDSDRGPAWRDLDVAVLHRGILERMLALEEGARYSYETKAAKAIDTVRQNGESMAFILCGTRAEQIRACAEAGESMPQKSTYFFPKLPSGGVIMPLE
jgi:uncharacterized protein (DUF1015 family)